MSAHREREGDRRVAIWGRNALLAIERPIRSVSRAPLACHAHARIFYPL